MKDLICIGMALVDSIIRGFDPQPLSRHLVEKRDVKVCVQHHGERSRDRCRAHQKHVRHHALVRKSSALLHSKAVLLIDDNKPQIRQLDRLLEQGMGSHQNTDLSLLRSLVNVPFLRSRHGAS